MLIVLVHLRLEGILLELALEVLHLGPFQFSRYRSGQSCNRVPVLSQQARRVVYLGRKRSLADLEPVALAVGVPRQSLDCTLRFNAHLEQMRLHGCQDLACRVDLRFKCAIRPQVSLQAFLSQLRIFPLQKRLLTIPKR